MFLLLVGTTISFDAGDVLFLFKPIQLNLIAAGTAMSDEKIFKYPGEQAEVHWDGRLCIHYGDCGRAEGELFVGGRQPWCQPDLAGDEEIRDVITRCPTGALTVVFKGETWKEAPASVNTVTVSQDGPLYISGDISIQGTTGDIPGKRVRAALCRCGLSANKPYCDNSHVEGGFKDSGAVGRKGDGCEGTGGELSVKPAPDGPLLLRGNLEIRAASGRAAWHGQGTALCRCGASQNKPFCDGSHKAAGFKSD
jgi:CDGSH-type Zn-finger protein/uncharacterized Fe-S cluster protein YjdI